MQDRNDLHLILSGHFPLITVQSHEEQRVLELLRGIALDQHRPLYRWSITEGLRADDSNGASAINWDRVSYQGQTRAMEEPDDPHPEEVLEKLRRGHKQAIAVLLDYHPYLQDPRVVRRLKELAMDFPAQGVSVVLLSHELELPQELKRLSASFRLSLPDQAQLKELLREEAEVWQMRNPGQKLRGDKEALQRLTQALGGLTLSDARRLMRNALYDDGAITHSDLPDVMRAKYDLIGQHGVLSFEYDTAKFAEVGGFRRLRRWIEIRQQTFLKPDAGLDPPKGVLLLGVQGGGKSLAAKAVAGAWGVPLLRLDIASLYNRYLGETEKNIRDSLRAAEAMAPCVLWVDEIEKAISSSESDDGTSRRVLGTLLTWMAEKKQAVFIVATANDIQALPPELVRKGRMDEIFFVDLPDAEVRADIFRIHMHKRGLHAGQYDIDRLAALSEGFSGAEIEQVVVAALYASHAGEPLNDALLAKEIEQTRPLSVVMAEQIDGLRTWAAGRTVASD
ncbi:AAA family ATPase [Thiosocius teredinicola]|uniref:AAA family ATPase n=1 Tax=Thiosocius teredinicola TaxID=1973002 RepID=UPI0009911EB7